MKYVQLGDRQVSAIGLGAWQFGAGEWGWGRDFDAQDARRIVHRALDLGVNLFDTAEVYGNGRSEEVLGAALQGRSDVFIATKVWPAHFTAGGVRAAAERSLRRLRRDRIDLYQLHWPNPLIPLSWTMRGMRELLDQGIIGAVGVSNFGLRRWRRAEQHLGRPVVANQVRYHLLHRMPERELIPYARSTGRIIIAYSPLAQGVLAHPFPSNYRPTRARATNPVYWPTNLPRLRPLTEAVAAVAAGRGVTPSQIALAWAIRDGSVVAIPGARRVEQIEANAAAADVDLSEEEVAHLDQAANAVRLLGPLRSTVRLIARR